MAMAVLPVPGLPARRMARPPIWILIVLSLICGAALNVDGMIDLKSVGIAMKSRVANQSKPAAAKKHHQHTHLSLINHSINNSHRLPSLSLSHHPLRPALARLQSIIKTEATNMRVCSDPFQASHFADCHTAGGGAGGVAGEFYTAHFVVL